MKLNYALVVSIVIAVGIVSFGFTWYHISTERAKLNAEIEYRAAEIASELAQADILTPEQKNRAVTGRILDSISNKYRLLGVAVYFNNDSIVGNQTALNLFPHSADFIAQSITAGTAQGYFFTQKGEDVYQYIKPLGNTNLPNSAFVIYTDAGYINNIIAGIWVRNFFRWFLQALAVSFVTVAIIRWGIYSPINKIVSWLKDARSGNIEQLKKQIPAGFLQPLHNEIISIANAMHEARAIAEEEAQLRSNAEAVWTPERLKIEVGNLLQGKKLIVVSNREPYMHIREGKLVKCIVPASGMITAMEPILKACGGLWIASGAGDADKETVDANDKLQVPPEAPAYTLKRLWQTKEEEDHFYYGFSNEGLWPLCHVVHNRPVFRKEDWHYYKKVNENFARAVLAETADDETPYILIQDYHFALLPQLIKKQKPNARVAIFWHIPWPNPESFGICPWQREILQGMLGADLIGFHTQYHCNNFLDTVNNTLESRVMWQNFSVQVAGHSTLVKPFPISIAFTQKDYNKASEETDATRLLADLGITAQYMGIGVDRMDYTKGIAEKFLAVERFFEKYPQYTGRFTFIQIGAPTRTLIKSYADATSNIEKEAERINWRFKGKNWKPIVLLKRHHSHSEITPYYAAANLCMVTSLHDGMNLVAKEFIAARNDSKGVLILSRFAGAAHELGSALIVNPYDIEKTADAIKLALEMDAGEQERRMKQMRQTIVEHNIYGWAANLIRKMANLQE